MKRKRLAPISNEFTSAIANRSFDIIEAGVSSKLVIEIGMPVQDVETVDGMDWRCPVRLVSGTSIQADRACGVDAVQALELALTLVSNKVQQLLEDKSRQILFDGYDANFLFVQDADLIREYRESNDQA